MLLTPRAQSLVVPLHNLLGDAQRLLRGGTSFEPMTAQRHFVIAARDFLSTLLLPPLLEAIVREAPGVSLEVVPSVRRGNAWLLEAGDLDLALGAIVEEAPGIRRMDLCTEGFSCAVRKGHPRIRGALDLDTYVEVPHLLITLGDDTAPTWVDRALAAVGRKRRVAARTRYFMSAPLVLARSELLLTGPSMLIRYFAEIVPLAPGQGRWQQWAARCPCYWPDTLRAAPRSGSQRIKNASRARARTLRQPASRSCRAGKLRADTRRRS